MKAQTDWFESWFNTPYYHILYQHRDNTEARFFIRNLIQEVKPSKESDILDLACGRGRHSVYLNELGYKVTGLDLSEENIAFASDFENDRLKFEVGDMRLPFGKERFDYIINLFTSFGYFEDRADNLSTCKMIHQALKADGMLIMDFMNVNKVKLGLVKEEVHLINHIEFTIERFIKDERVIKRVSFNDNDRAYQFEERVQLLELNDFKEMFNATGLQIERIFGDFELNPFDADQSERLILFVTKA